MKFTIAPKKIKKKPGGSYEVVIPMWIMRRFAVKEIVVVYLDTTNKKIPKFGKRKEDQKELVSN